MESERAEHEMSPLLGEFKKKKEEGEEGGGVLERIFNLSERRSAAKCI